MYHFYQSVSITNQTQTLRLRKKEKLQVQNDGVKKEKANAEVSYFDIIINMDKCIIIINTLNFNINNVLMLID